MEKLSDGRGNYYYFFICLFVCFRRGVFVFIVFYSVALVLNLPSWYVVSFAIFLR